MFDQIERLPTLRARLGDALTNSSITADLRDRHGLQDDEIAAWVEAIGTTGLGRRIVDADRPTRDRLAGLMRDISWTDGLSESDLQALSERLYLATYADGDVLFQRGDRGDRQFIVEDGEVLVVPPVESQRAHRLGPGKVFGSYAFATGVTRRGTAIALGRARVWVMRRRDLDRVLAERPELRSRGLDTSRPRRPSSTCAPPTDSNPTARRASSAQRTSRRCRAGQPPSCSWPWPRAALLAIWLGILLDGVPESFVIGASIER